MKSIRPGLLVLAGLVAAATLVPAAVAVWLRGTDSFIGGSTIIGSNDGRPHELSAASIYVILGVLSAVAYGVPAGVAFFAFRRAGAFTRNLVTVVIFVFAVGAIVLRIVGRL